MLFLHCFQTVVHEPINKMPLTGGIECLTELNTCSTASQQGRLEELFDLYKSNSGVAHASKTTFLDVYRKRWARCLSFRAIGHHSRCTLCGKISEMRALATTKDRHPWTDLDVIDRPRGDCLMISASGHSVAEERNILSIALHP